MATVRWIDVVVIVAYMAALLSLGLRFSRRQTSTERYFVAKRSIPGWATGMSLLATLISSVTFIAYPGSAYAGDWSNLVPGLMVVPVLAVAALVVIPFFRHTVRTSAYEYFGRRFGYPARVYGSIAYALGHFSKMGFVFYLLALTVSSMTGWKTDSVIILVGIVTVAYTLAGGIEAVIWADVIQGFALWLGIAICVGYLLLLPAEGPGAVMAHAWHSGKISLGSMAPDFTKPTVLVLAIYGFFYYLQRYTADQTVVQRYLVAHTDRAALRGIALGSLLCIPVWTLFMLIGTLCWEFYRSAPPAMKADQVFPYFITTHVPPGLAGLFLAALFGAAMANLSSDFNSLAAIAVEDYYRVLRPASSERRRLVVAKAVVAACGALCIVIATVLAHTNGTALGLWYTVSAIVAGGLAGLFLLAFLVARAGATAAYMGIGASLVFTTWATLTLDGGRLWDMGRFNFPLHNYMIGVIGHLVLVGIGSVACFFFPNRNLEAREMTLWGWLRQSGVNVCVPVE
ncbi:SSS sodium solute transporter superfamily [Candidatus Sulfopaludibacter sp. SbA3]|nr:SSS sodium solute transporter superfamily [Candidatus Sulfopaludibacter sp. SbA3]